MGFDKGTLVYNGRRVLTMLSDIAASLNLEAVISCRKEQEYLNDLPLAKIYDCTPHKGPAAGLGSAMVVSPLNSWLCLPCDMPLLDKELLSNLLHRRNRNKAATVFGVSEGDSIRVNPFPGIYEIGFQSILEESLKMGQWSLKKMIESSNCEIVPIKPSEAFLNVNRPQDLRD